MGGYRCTQSPAAGHVLLYQQGRCYPSITLQGEQVVWGWGKHLPVLGDVFHGASEIGPGNGESFVSGSCRLFSERAEEMGPA